MQHAGDAIWYLYAELTMLERRYSTEPSTLELLGKMREALNMISSFVKIDPPPPESMQSLIEQIAGTVLQDVGVPQYEEQSKQERQPARTRRRSDFESPKRIESAKTILDEMVASGAFDWANMVADIHQKLENGGKFVTDKQLRAIVNIGSSCDDGEHWEKIREEYPEAMKIVEDAAANA